MKSRVIVSVVWFGLLLLSFSAFAYWPPLEGQTLAANDPQPGAVFVMALVLVSTALALRMRRK